MKICRYNDLVEVPWKNGGGVTREIVRRHMDDGQLVWRLSIADVASEGPFSAFPGLQRILTVIEGEGMVLERLTQDALAADLFKPVAFSGDEPINGLLPNGPCRDFNVIWNPKLARATVTVFQGPKEFADSATDESMGLLCLSGSTLLSTGQTLAPLDFALFESKSECAHVAEDSMALLIGIAPVSKP